MTCSSTSRDPPTPFEWNNLYFATLRTQKPKKAEWLKWLKPSSNTPAAELVEGVN